MKKIFASFIIAGLILWSCDSTLTDPQKIVDKTIAASGGDKYQHSKIEFDFRGRHYIASRQGGSFSYERVFTDSTDTIHDYVTNEGFKREINGEKVEVIDSMATKYTSSTNSVNYFALLPYGLNDESVVKKFLGETVIGNKPYYKIQVTFRAEGGGEDFEDIYLYWIHQQDFTVDYLAYSFAEDDETSFRFRVAYNPRIVEGIRFQDYINFKPDNNALKVDQAEDLYKEGKLIELSRIETENVKVALF